MEPGRGAHRAQIGDRADARLVARVGEVGVLEQRAGHVGIDEQRPGQVGIDQARLGEIGAREFRARKIALGARLGRRQTLDVGGIRGVRRGPQPSRD